MTLRERGGHYSCPGTPPASFAARNIRICIHITGRARDVGARASRAGPRQGINLPRQRQTPQPYTLYCLQMFLVNPAVVPVSPMEIFSKIRQTFIYISYIHMFLKSVWSPGIADTSLTSDSSSLSLGEIFLNQKVPLHRYYKCSNISSSWTVAKGIFPGQVFHWIVCRNIPAVTPCLYLKFS